MAEGGLDHVEGQALDLVAAHVVGDMAYTVGYEHTRASVNGEPRMYTLRATQVYRREGGEWKVVHRHGDTLSAELDRDLTQI